MKKLKIKKLICLVIKLALKSKEKFVLEINIQKLKQ